MIHYILLVLHHYIELTKNNTHIKFEFMFFGALIIWSYYTTVSIIQFIDGI